MPPLITLKGLAKRGHSLVTPRSAQWIRDLAFAGVCLAMVTVPWQGCVIIPIPAPEHGLLHGHGAIAEAETNVLEVGKTTREEILLQFGEPQISFNEDRMFLYTWEVIRGYVLVGVAYLFGGVGVIPKDYLVFLEFDEYSKLKRIERTSLGVFDQSIAKQMDQWISPGSTALAEIATLEKRSAREGSLPIILAPAPHIPEHHDSALASVPALRIKIEEFVDERGAIDRHQIGTNNGRMVTLTTVGRDVYLAQRANTLVRNAVEAEWTGAGHILVEDNQDVTLKGHLLEFEVTGNDTDLVVDGSVDLVLEVLVKDAPTGPIRRRYDSRQWKIIIAHFFHFRALESAIHSCLQDIMSQMVSDADLTRHVAGKHGLHLPNQPFH